jgi:predicted ATP-dependent serine protease
LTNQTTAPKAFESRNKDNEFGFDVLISEEIKRTRDQKSEIAEHSGLFSVKSANTWIEEAKKRAIPTKLFHEFWFAFELCILFADTNVGKSILAVQIANLIAGLQPVLYFDFELSDKQFEARYSKEYTDHYQFSNHFYRAEIDPDGDFEGFDSFEDYLIHSLEKTIVKAGIKILIIDNITYLKNETEKAKYALPLMKQLKALKKKYGLSILVLAHTPKRDLSKPITQNDLQGSKMLINFCDSAFAIGASQVDSNIRYLKQIKQRNTEQLYGADNVMVFQIVKPSNYLFMEFIGYNSEREHLKIFTERDREKMIEETKLLSSKGKSQRQIAAELRISLGAVNKYLNKTP